ncbi:hypothetical protein [Melittangium boletus]|uniref:hypothetical protein n=1 Tax=Melittangium boletus TaxID=83453 RepID=UPI003DA5E788
MKKLLTAMVLTLGTVAMAEQPPAQTNRPSTGVDATQVGPAITNTAKDVKDAITEGSSESVKTEKTYSANGTLKSVDGDSLVLSRSNRKDSSFELRPDTVVMLNDRKVEASALPEGSQIRARFHRDGQKMIVTEINATHPSK